MSAAARWDAFWTRPGNTSSLGLFRILLAICLWHESQAGAALNSLEVVGGYHLPYLDLIPLPSSGLLQVIRLLEYPLIVLFGLGLFTRGAIAGLLLLRGYLFFADRLVYSDVSYFFLLLLLLLFFSPCDEGLSLKRYLRRRSGQPIADDGYLGAVRPLTLQRLIQIQVSTVYLFSALHKTDPWYFGGYRLSRFASQNLLQGFSGDAFRALLPAGSYAQVTRIAGNPLYWFEPAVVSVLLELFLACGLWFRRTRRVAIVAGVIYHLLIAWIAGAHIAFSGAMIASYLLFVEPSWLPGRLAELFGDTAAPRLEQQST